MGRIPLGNKLRRLLTRMERRPRIHPPLPTTMLQVLQGGGGVRCDEEQADDEGDHCEVHEPVY